jgi:hypothetical protein
MSSPTRVRGLGVIALMVIACLGNETTASSVLDITEDGWHTWRAPAIENSKTMCCFSWTGSGARERICDLDRGHGNYSSSNSVARYSGDIQVYALIEAGQASKIAVLSPQCEVVANTEISDLGSVSADDSIDWLRPYINAKSDVASDALAAISRHQGNYAFQVLAEVVESQADYDLREEAVFWIVMSETEKAFAYIDRLIMGE